MIQYNVDYLLCSIVFVLIIAIHFFGKYRFPSLQNKIFGIIVIVAMGDIVLDVVTAYTIDNAAYLPFRWVDSVACIAFYSLQAVLVVLMYIYVLSILVEDGLRSIIRDKAFIISLVPFLATIILLFTNHFTGWIFYYDILGRHQRGKLFAWIFVEPGFYIVLTMYLIVRGKRRLKALEYETIKSLMIIVLIASAVQWLYPKNLIIGVALALAIVMTYLTLQNSDEMLDDMTGTFDRSSCLEFLKSTFQKRNECFLVVIGLDEMKIINNVFGMNVGNGVICNVADAMKAGAERGPVFRMMGDQFAVLCKSKKKCESLIEDLQEVLVEGWDIEGIHVSVSACFCCIMEETWEYSVSETMMIMEYIMQKGKEQGKGSVLVANQELLQERRKELELEKAVIETIKEEALNIYIQPIYSCEKERFTSAEVLVRCFHPKLGIIPPSEFIPLAEQKGLIIDIGRQVLEKTCQAIKRYRLEETDLECVEINLSAAEFMQGSLVSSIISTMEKYEVSPHFICFEITETVATATYKETKEKMNRMISEGIRFALDDYGMGYANVDTIIRLPFSIIKLDRNFLLSAMENKKNAIVFEKTVQMMKELNYKLVVEGVETQEQKDYAQGLHTDYIQGYYYSTPLPVKKFADLLKEKYRD